MTVARVGSRPARVLARRDRGVPIFGDVLAVRCLLSAPEAFTDADRAGEPNRGGVGVRGCTCSHSTIRYRAFANLP